MPDQVWNSYGYNSFHRGTLPEGCKRCIQGEKLVLFTTGRCGVGCYYCTIPQSQESDIIKANEVRIDPSQAISQIIEESTTSMATGCGITGGDPLIRSKRVIEYIKILKSTFGEDYHIHLYTSGKYLDLDLAEKLVKAGLDEIRLHPKNLNTPSILELARKLKENYQELPVGIEIPAIPGKLDAILNIIEFADNNGLDFVNLNEFEFTQSNFTQLTSRGYNSVFEGAAVSGSFEMFEELKQSLDQSVKVPVHFCSSSAKDARQLTQRFKKRANQIARVFDSISDDGQLEYGRLILDSPKQLRHCVEILHSQFDIPADLMEIREDENTIETAWLIVDELIDELRIALPKIKGEIIVRHPIENGPITRIDPI